MTAIADSFPKTGRSLFSREEFRASEGVRKSPRHESAGPVHCLWVFQAARAIGIHLGIEPTSHLYSDVSIAHRLSDAVTLARKAAIGVMIDLFACWADSDIESAIADAGPMCPLIQVSDYVYGDRGLPGRAVPGDGALPFGRLVPAIVQSGFRGWFDLEIIGPRLQAEGQDKGLRRAAETMSTLLERSGFRE